MVKGSSLEPYKVSFTKNKNNINAFCTCPAGKNGQHCKHRFSIVACDSEAVVSLNKEQVAVIKSWLKGSELEKALIRFTEAKHQYDEAKKAFNFCKKNIVRAMGQ